MSWKASAAVKDLRQDSQGKTLTPSEKCFLYTLADYYDEERRCAWPSVKRAASESMISERQASRIISDLQKRGIFTVEHRKNDTSLYRFQFGPYVKIEVEIPPGETGGGGDNMALSKELPPVTHDGPRPTENGVRGDIATAYKPPVTSKEPPTTLFDQGSNGHSGNGVALGTSKKKPACGKPKPGRRFDSAEAVVAKLTDDPWEREKIPLIWTYYCQQTDRGETYAPTEERIKLGIERLRDLVSLYRGDKDKARAGFRIAIDNLANNKFLAGENDRQTEYRDFGKHLCRNWEVFERRMLEK